MARRSVSLPSDLERAVRLLQARLLTAIDRDISFNETLNLALAAGFSVPGLAKVIDEDRWSALLDGSEWQSNGTISDAGKQVLEAIAPAAARRHARSKTPSETAKKRSATKVAPKEKALLDSISDAPESPRAAPGDGVAVDDGVAATQVAADISIQGMSAESALSEAGFRDWGVAPTRRAEATPVETVPVAPVLDEPTGATLGDAVVDAAADQPTPWAMPDPRVAEVLEGIVVPEAAVEVENAPAVEDQLEPVAGAFGSASTGRPAGDVEREDNVGVSEVVEGPGARPSGPMDFDALRRAIMAGDGEPPERPVPPASEPTPPPIPRDADSFAARMAGFAGEAAHAEGLIVPEVVFAMPATDEANNASEPASEDAATEPPPTLSDAEAEEPVVQPPEDQAAGYRDLDRALQDAAAAYEERLRNSGAS